MTWLSRVVGYDSVLLIEREKWPHKVWVGKQELCHNSLPSCDGGEPGYREEKGGEEGAGRGMGRRRRENTWVRKKEEGKGRMGKR